MGSTTLSSVPSVSQSCFTCSPVPRMHIHAHAKPTLNPVVTATKVELEAARRSDTASLKNNTGILVRTKGLLYTLANLSPRQETRSPKPCLNPLNPRAMMYVYIYIYIYYWLCIYIYTFTYTYIYTHTHTRNTALGRHNYTHQTF